MLFPQRNIGLFDINLYKIGSPNLFFIEKCHKTKDNVFFFHSETKMNLFRDEAV